MALGAARAAFAAAPTAATTAASSITTTSALLNGSGVPNGEATTGWFRIATTSPGTCNDTFGTRVPATSGTALGMGSTSVPYAISTTGLSPGTTYYFCAIVSNASATAVGAVLSFTTPAAPGVVTTGASSIASNSALLNGSVNPTASTTTAWFRVSPTDPGSCNDTFGSRIPSSSGQALGNGTTPVAYSFNTGSYIALTPGVTYYYCAIANNTIGTSFGSVVSFTTLPVVPSVTTTTASALSATGATLNSTVNPGGGTTTGWFRYSPTNPGSCSDTFGTRIPTTGASDIGSGNNPLPFSQPITGLTQGTTYYYCAIATNSAGTTLGNLFSFVTPTAPAVTTVAVSTINDTNATLPGTVNPDGAATTAWFRYATTSPGTCNDTFGTRLPAGSGGQDMGSGNSALSFSLQATGLAPTTTYYYCAIASNALGTSFGAVMQFTTRDRPAVTTNAATSLTYNTAVFNATANPNGASAIGWFRYAATDPGSCNDSFGTRLPSSSGQSLGLGTTPVGYSLNTGNYVALLPGTTYYYCAIASNTYGTSVGSVVSFTTPPAVPSVSTGSVTGISAGGATLNGSAYANGGTTTGWFRYATTNPGSCNDTFGTRAPASGGSNLGASPTASTSYFQAITGLAQGTTYYYCAIASNAAGTGTGGIGSFTTPSAPTVTTNTVSGISNVQAQLNASANPNGDPATGWFRLSTTNPGTCDDMFGTRVPTVGSVTLGGGTGTTSYSQPASGLTANTTYYVCAIAQNSLGTSFGQVVSFQTFDQPVTTTAAATSIFYNQAVLNGAANPNGSSTLAWFRYDTTNPTTCNDTFGTRIPFSSGASLSNGRSPVSYSYNTGNYVALLPGTTYYYCAIANNSYGTSFGAVMSFTTPPIAPSVSTGSVSALTSATATINGSGIPGGATTTAWFRYSPTNPGGCSDTFGTRVPAMTGGTNLGAGNVSVAFSQDLTGLSQGVTYYYCAIASNSVATVFGTLFSFTTPSAPNVTTNAASGIGDTTATLSGTANPDGAAATGWFRYSTTNPITCDDMFGTRVPSGSGGTSLGSGTSNVSFNISITGLTANTTYYYCAIASNPLGTSFGQVVSFTTRAPAAVTTLAATSLTYNTAVFNGTANPNGASTTGWFRYNSTDPGTCNDTFGTRLPSSSGQGLGNGMTPVGFSLNTGNYVALLPGTTYYYCAIAQNSFGTSFGAVVSFTTPPTLPQVSTIGAFTVTATSATLGAQAIAGGGATTGWFRYSPTSPGSCSDTFGTRVPAMGGSDLGSSPTAQVAYTQPITGLTQGTTYYFCALASNPAGVTFGVLASFTTPTAPSVTTSPVSSINDTSATFQGSANPNRDTTTGWFRFSTTNPVTCDDMFGTRVPSTSGTGLGNGSNAVGFAQTVSGLTANTTYYVCALAANSLGTAMGSVVTFTTRDKPAVTTGAATSLTYNTAVFNATANPNGASATGWFRYATTSPGTCNDTFGTRLPSSSGQGLGAVTTPVAYTLNTGNYVALLPGTTYYYCAIANNAYGTGFGAVVSFTTPPAIPSVSTGSASGITSAAATLNGSAYPQGGASTGWFRYSTTNPGSCNDSFGTRAPTMSGGSDLGSSPTASSPFSQAITGLTQGTTYYFCAIASNSAGTSFGGVGSFVTLTSPTVTTNAASSVSNLAAQLNGSANPNGDNAVGWFRMSTTNPVTCDDTFGTRVPTVGNVTLGGGTSPASYSQPASGLTANATYYYCAIASNSLGTSFGQVVSFQLFDKPTVATAPATSVVYNSAVFNGSANPNGSSATGWFRYDTNNPGTCNDTFGTRLPSSSGTGLSNGRSPVAYTLNTGNYVVLQPGTTYYYCAIANNSYGFSVGSVVSFTTPPILPSVTTNVASNLTSTTATINGSAVPGGATTTGWFRYSNTNPGLCSDTFGTRVPATGGTDLGAGNATVPFSQALTGLSPNVTYYFCAIGSNSQGISYGSLLSFTAPATPTVATLAATPVTSMTATLNGSANPNGLATTGWFRYATASPASCNDTFGTRVPTAAGTGTSLGASTSVVPYSQALTSLLPGTTYYFCAIASNVQGTAFGQVLSFTTPVSDQAPGVTTVAASGVTGTAATLNGSANPNGAPSTGWFRYATTSPGSCNDTFGTRTPGSGGTALGSGNSPMSYSQAVSGLTAGTTYFFCALAQNGAGTSVGSVLSFTTPVAPSVTTDPASSVGSTTATLNGSANPRGAATTGWFRYDTTNPGSCDDSFGTRIPSGSGGAMLGAGTTDVNFTQAITGLTTNTTYYYCAIAQNGAGTSFGAVQTFVTPIVPTVLTLDASSVSSTGATLNGSANPNGGTSTGWFRFDTTNPGTCDDTFGMRVPATGGFALGAGSSAAPFTQPLTGLSPNTTYYFCALAGNSVGTSVGAVLSFTTPAPATATTAPATAIGGTGASLNGAGNPHTAAAVGYFRYATTNPGSCNDTFGTRVPAAAGTALGAGTADVAFSETLTGLMRGTTYYFCAIAQNSEGTGFGAVMSFTTLATPTVTTVAASGVTSTGVTFNGSANPGGDTAIGYFRYSTTNPGACSDTFGTRSPVTGGSALGAGTASVPFAQAESGLQPGTTYYFCAIAQNSVGTSFGAVQSFITLAAPTVTTLAATGVGSTAATLNGQAAPNGAATNGYFRYGTTDPAGACDDLFGTRVPATGGTALGSGSAATPFSQALTGLQPGTTYYFCAIAENVVGATGGTVLTFSTTAIAPVVTTSPVTGTSITGAATLNGSANPNGGSSTGWFRYASTDPGTCTDSFGTRVPAGTGGSPLGSGTANVAFSQNLTALSAGVTYYFCALASNSAGTAFGQVLSFRIDAPAPSVSTEAATGVTATAATLNGSANPNGFAATGWFRYDTSMPAACNDSFGTRAPAAAGSGTDLGTGSTAAPFMAALTGLEPNQTYYYCAIASNTGGAAFGNPMSFTTMTAAPAVRTLAVVTETDGHKTLNGAANPHGVAGAGWFLYGTTDPGTCTSTSTFGTRVPAADIAIASGHADAMFETTLGTLAPGTYYYCAAASNSVGTTYGMVVSFVVPQPLPDGGIVDGGGMDGGTGGAGGAGGRGGAGGSGGAGGGNDAGVDAGGGAGGSSGGAGGRGGAGGGGGSGGATGGAGGATGGTSGSGGATGNDGSVADGGGNDGGRLPAPDKGCGCGFASGSPGSGGALAGLVIALGLTIRRRRRGA